ncbi:MAG: hypothetical protein P1U77_22815, partial [Rubripirellula sp.]|nr:hypothetical protein [Rubripirellula sp.]
EGRPHSLKVQRDWLQSVLTHCDIGQSPTAGRRCKEFSKTVDLREFNAENASQYLLDETIRLMKACVR